MLSDRAKALRPVIQAAFDAGGLDAICELFAKLEARIEELEKRLNMNSSQIIRDRNNQNILALAYLLWNHSLHGTQTLDRALGGL